MKKLTNTRKTIFRNTFNLDIPFDTKLRLTKGLFEGKRAYIFAAGPSLSNVNIDKLKPQLENNLAICIKQSINVVGDECDLLLMNFCNFNDYDWHNMLCPTVWTSFDAKHSEIIKSREIKCNALLPVIENSKNNIEGLSTSTAGKKMWSNFYRFSEGYAIWGPGLMYELAIPFALNCGVNHITLVGWDIGTLSKSDDGAFLNEHFYQNKKIEMKTKITNVEMEIVANSTKDLKHWLSNLGVGLSVVSDRSLVDDTVERENKWLK
jgi:hypothetical protein